MRLIEEGWRSFEENIFAGEPVDPIQREEMRRAFYCGAALLQLLNEQWDDLNTIEQLAFRASLKAEIEEFKGQMMNEAEERN